MRAPIILGQWFKKGVGDFKLPLHRSIATAAGGRRVEYRQRRNRSEPHLATVRLDDDVLPVKRSLDEGNQILLCLLDRESCHGVNVPEFRRFEQSLAWQLMASYPCNNWEATEGIWRQMRLDPGYACSLRFRIVASTSTARPRMVSAITTP